MITVGEARALLRGAAAAPHDAARLCSAILLLEAIVLGLSTPVLISVASVDTGRALWIGLGLTARAW